RAVREEAHLPEQRGRIEVGSQAGDRAVLELDRVAEAQLHTGPRGRHVAAAGDECPRVRSAEGVLRQGGVAAYGESQDLDLEVGKGGRPRAGELEIPSPSDVAVRGSHVDDLRVQRKTFRCLLEGAAPIR